MAPKHLQTIGVKGKMGNTLPLSVCLYRTRLKVEQNLNCNENAWGQLGVTANSEDGDRG